MLNDILVDEIIVNGLKEDINQIDITSDNLIEENSICKAYMLAKEDGVVAGVSIVKRVFSLLDKNITVNYYVNDGDEVKKGQKILSIEGSTRSVLKGERLALNFIQRMSGIATMSRKYSKLVEKSPVRIVDTRKTTPGLRILEKYAVRTGGCYNHRYNLSDSVMIKDNHIKALGSIKKAVSKIKERIPHTTKIEVEVQNLSELVEAIEAGVDIIMLDNMNIDEMKKAVQIANKKVLLEVSGGITIERISEIAEIGIDIISVGALTHSVKALDISLIIDEIMEP